jgi:hypothetical protein
MSYTLTEIANTTGIFDSLFEGAPAINNSGEVTWNALLDNGESGIYTGTPSSIVTIATTPYFSGFGYPSINDSGQTTFSAVKGGKSGIYFSSKNSASPTVVASEGQLLTDVKRTEKFNSFKPDPAINNRGQVAFLAGLTDNNSGLFVGNDKGKISRIADTVGKFGNLEFADLLGTPFEGDVVPSINEKGDTVFWGLLDQKLPEGSAEYSQINPAFMSGNVRGIYLKSGNSEIQTIVDNTGKYLSFPACPDINNSGDVAYLFRGDDSNNVGTSYRGINVYDNGKTTTLIDNNDHKGKDGYDDVDKFFRFGFVDINDSSTIAFSAQFDPLGDVGNDGLADDPVLGVFTAHQIAGGGVEIDKVVAVGDTVNLGTGDKKVSNVLFFNNDGFNNQGQLAFSLAFDDGTQGIYRADQFTGF